MNENANRAVEILTAKAEGGELQFDTPTEKEILPDIIDFAKKRTKANAIAVLQKLHKDVDRFFSNELDLEGQDRKAKLLIHLILCPYLDNHKYIYGLYYAIKDTAED